MKFETKIISLKYIIFSNNHSISKIFIRIIQLILFLLLFIIYLKFIKIKNSPKFLSSYKHYIKDCFNLKNYKRIKIKSNNTLYVSICLPAYNMKKYIEKSILSILNQSFQNFEIIIVNDNSNDNTKDIILRLQSKYDRIKLIKSL